MAKGTPAYNVYESRSAPQAAASPFRRAADFGAGIGAALSRAGQAIQNYQETDLAVKRQQAQDDEDAGRIQAAQRMADFRTQVSQMQRDVFEQAPNGYENATHTAATNFEALRTQFMSDGLASPQANRFFAEASGLYQPQFLDGVAQQEAGARDQYQADTISNTTEQYANILIGDPSQYDRIHTEATAALGGIRNPNLRRDAEHRINRGLSAAAISGLINRDPGGTLRRLQASEPDPLVANLGAEERGQAIRQAHAEVDRRAAQWRAQVAQSVASAERMMDLGLPTENAPSLETVRAALGPERALAYEASRAQSTQFGRLSTMTTPELVNLMGDQGPPTNEHDAIIRIAEQRGAAQIIQERQRDPMQAQVRQGLVPNADIIGAVRQGDWNMVNGILASRAAAAQENGRRLGMPAMPLTAFEAQAIGPIIRAMPAAERAALLRNFAAWTGGGQAYTNMMAQLFPSSPATAYAGYISGIRGAHGEVNGDLIMRGEDLLGGRNADGTTTHTPLVSLPSEDKLRAEWRRQVGDAYAGFGRGAHPNSEAEEQTYQVFRSAYAALSYDAHDVAPMIADPARVGRAIAVATGGIMQIGGHRVIVPPGMTQGEFRAGLRAGFSRWEQLRGQDVNNYAYRPVGLTANGGGRYMVYHGDDPVMSPAGLPVEIEVRR